MEFEWNAAKEQSNIDKHGITFAIASLVFQDPNLLEFEDLGMYDESRWIAIGMVGGRILFVVYTERDDRIRIISARGAERHERRRYYNPL